MRIPLSPRTGLGLACGVIAASALLLPAPAPARPAGPQPSKSARSAKAVEAIKAMNRMPVRFIENRGQMPGAAAYYVTGRDSTVEFLPTGLDYHFARRAPSALNRLNGPSAPPAEAPAHRLRLEFAGANPAVRVTASGQQPTRVSYFNGARADADIPVFDRVTYQDLWPGIDLAYTGGVQRLKYEFIVKPGADPSAIRLAWRGASNVSVDAEGALRVDSPGGAFTDEKPFVYQDHGAKRAEVSSAYSVRRRDDGAFEYGFTLGDYDRSKTLVVDPAQFVYATFIGGGADDRALGVAVDSAGSAYVTGRTWNTTTSSYDVFVAKAAPDGASWVYVAFIGGSSTDEGFDIAVDSTGAAYVVGATSSTNYPRTIGPDITYGGGAADAFISKVNPAGNALVYSGFLGGSGTDFAEGVAVDVNGYAYVEGPTESTQATFPALVGPDLTHNGRYDTFVAKVTPTGSGLVYRGYIGGSGDDTGILNGFVTGGHIALDNNGALYVSGQTKSSQTTFPNGNGFGTLPSWDKTLNGNADGYVAKVRPDGTGLEWAGYIGGKARDWAFGMAVDAAGNAYVTGETESTEATFPTGTGFGSIPGYDKTYGGATDAFVAKIAANGTQLLWCTYLGGNKLDNGNSIQLDASGNLYIAGHAESPTFPVAVGPDLTFNGPAIDGDAFIMKMSNDGTTILYSGFIGGEKDDHAFWVAVDGFGNAYVVGDTASTQAAFPNGNGMAGFTSIDPTYNGGGWDGFLVKISN